MWNETIIFFGKNVEKYLMSSVFILKLDNKINSPKYMWFAEYT